MASSSSHAEASSNDNRSKDQDHVFSEENLQNYDINYFRKKLWQAAETGDSSQFVETIRLIAKKVFGSDNYILKPLVVGNEPVNASQMSRSTTTTTTANDKGGSNPPINTQAAQAQLSTILLQNHASNSNKNDNQPSNINNTNNQHPNKISDQNLSHVNKAGFIQQWLDNSQSQAVNHQVNTQQLGQQASAITQQQINHEKISKECNNDKDQVKSNTIQEKAAVVIQIQNGNNDNNEDQEDETQQSNNNQLLQNNSKFNAKLHYVLDYDLKYNYFLLYFMIHVHMIYENLMILIYVCA